MHETTLGIPRLPAPSIASVSGNICPSIKSQPVKATAVRIVLENRLPPTPTVEHMVNRPCKFNARFASHENRSYQLPSAPAKSEILESTPFHSTAARGAFSESIPKIRPDLA
jgi:hypothetical protein